MRSLRFHSGPTKARGNACGSRRPQTVVVTAKDKTEQRAGGVANALCFS